MSDQHPGVEDEVERALRLGLATASQMADRFARARQDLARQAQHRDQQEARQLEARYRAEGASATARLAVVDRTEWWDHATPADITSMWHLAAQWQNDQSRAAIAVETIARQVQDRYDIDVRAPGVEAKTVHAALARLDEEQRVRAGRRQVHDDNATAVGAVLRAEQRDASLAEQTGDSRQDAVIEKDPDVDRVALHELEAEQHDWRDAGRAAARIPGELRALPADARAQASLHSSEASAIVTQGGSNPAPPYDSIERREQTALRLHQAALPLDTVAVATRADVAHSRPADEGVIAPTTPSRAGLRRAARGAQRTDRSR
jgi:hypothetical protein